MNIGVIVFLYFISQDQILVFLIFLILIQHNLTPIVWLQDLSGSDYDVISKVLAYLRHMYRNFFFSSLR